ncbi:MAG: PAS domain S-box protein, partial [Kiritimatiellaeota bacterium]|nr:PAS domain S-box protein [Kiritimatiellota bacterium]
MSAGQPIRKEKEVSGGEEVRYRSLFEAVQESILILNAVTGLVTDVNPAAIKLLGFPHEALLGKQVWELGGSEDRVANKTRFATLLTKDKVHFDNLTLATSDGRKITVEFESIAYQVDQQRVIQCNIRDITASKQAEVALREHEASLQSILESTADGILAIDEHGKVLKANPRFAELWRIPEKVLKGGDDEALLHFVLDQLTEPAEFLKEVRRLYASAELASDTLTFKDRRVFERRSAPLHLEGSIRGRVWSFSHIT